MPDLSPLKSAVSELKSAVDTYLEQQPDAPSTGDASQAEVDDLVSQVNAIKGELTSPAAPVPVDPSAPTSTDPPPDAPAPASDAPPWSTAATK